MSQTKENKKRKEVFFDEETGKIVAYTTEETDRFIANGQHKKKKNNNNNKEKNNKTKRKDVDNENDTKKKKKR